MGRPRDKPAVTVPFDLWSLLRPRRRPRPGCDQPASGIRSVQGAERL